MRAFLLLALVVVFTHARAQTEEEYLQQAHDAFKKKEYKSALTIIDKAFADGASAEVYEMKALILEEMKRYKEAVDTYNKGLSVFPRKLSLYNSRGLLLQKLGEFEYSLKDFSIALDLADTDSATRIISVNLASTKLLVRDFNGAYDDLMRAYKIDSTDVAVLTNLGAVCDEVGRGDETLKYLLKCIEVNPDFYAAYGNIGYKYQEMGQYQKAIEMYNKVLEFDPNEPLGYSNRSYNKMKLGDLKGAMKDIDRSIALYPANSYAYKVRALIWIAEGKTRRACEDLQLAIDKGYTGMYGDEVETLQKAHCK